MASIVIKDLNESVDLDRKAMLAVIGGARARGRHPLSAQAMIKSNRIVTFPGMPARGFGQAKGSLQP
ncbi:MAG TPA: hypothetical protein VGE12_06515 [Noviherbaspirillum sp.]